MYVKRISIVGQRQVDTPAHSQVYSIQHYVINFVSELPHFRWVFSGYPVFLHQLNWSPRYNWNIVENGVNQPNINYYAIIFWIMRIKISIITYWLANCFKVYMNIYGLIRTTFWKVSPLLANYISTITYMVKILEDRNLKLVFAVFL